MVHALEESWRVLVPGGIMVDVRPLSVDVPLEVVFTGGSEKAGLVDMSPDLEYDIAADRSVDTVVNMGIFGQTSLEIFDYAYHWKTFHSMVEDFNERWQDEINVAAEVMKKARKIYLEMRPNAHLRLPMRMKMGKYVKHG
jgi:hypothetical protein